MRMMSSRSRVRRENWCLIRKKKVWIRSCCDYRMVVLPFLNLYQLRTREHARMLALEKKISSFRKKIKNFRH